MCFGSITRQTGVRGMWFTGTGIWRRRRVRLINGGLINGDAALNGEKRNQKRALA